MAQVSEGLRADTARADNGSYHFTVVAERAGVTARSTSTYQSQADALSASARMDEAVEAEVVECEGGYAVRLISGTLEAVSDAYPQRAQAETAFDALTG